MKYIKEKKFDLRRRFASIGHNDYDKSYMITVDKLKKNINLNNM